MNLLKSSLIAIAMIVLSSTSLTQAADVNLNTNIINSSSGGTPSNVTNFKAEAGDTQIKLTWENPTVDFQGVRIQRKTDYYPSSATEGDNVYDGIGTSFIDTGLTNGLRYYYTAFAYNKPSEYASGAIASAIPWITQLQETPEEDLPVLPETKKDKETPGEITKKGDIEFSDFQFFVKQDLGWVQIPFLEKNHFFTGEEFLISISKDIFQKEVSVIIFSLGSSSYLLTEKDGNYQTINRTPEVKGDYTATLNIVFKDGTIKTLTKDILVDPYGYVYKKTKSFAGLFQKGVFEETRILDAKVTLYYYDQSKSQWMTWDGAKYKQENPQKTNRAGEYGFMVPSGKYYLEVQKSGYHLLKTEEFEVKEQIVTKNLELQPAVSGLLKVVVIILAIIVLVGLPIYFIRRAKKRAPAA